MTDKDGCCFTCALSFIGALVVLKFLYNVFSLIKLHFLSGSNLRKFGANDGAWAVVTGASDGIGKAYAKQLAKRGFNIVLVSRTESKLKDVAEEIKKESSKVSTQIVTIDLANATPEDFQKKIGSAVKDLDVGVLVNNAGLSYDYPELFLEVNEKLLRDIVAVNISAVNEITRIVLPVMVKKGRGLVINISSASSIVPSPLLAVYSASKAYIDTFSQALAAEYRSKGIIVECQVPFFVVSAMSKISRKSFTTPFPDDYVKAALSKAGNATIYSPYGAHALLAWGMSLLPTRFLISKNKQLHESIKRRALAKRKAQ